MPTITLDWTLVFGKLENYFNGAMVTLGISVATLVIAMALGVVLALMRDARNGFLKGISAFYIWIWRGTPLLVQAYLIYFGLPNLGIKFSPMTAGILTMSLNTSAFVAEIVRSGIHAVDFGQREAARALGMSWWLEMRRIVAPQAATVCILPLINQFIASIKNTSILSVITIVDLTREATLIAYSSFHYFEPYAGIAVIYLILTTFFTAVAKMIEKRLVR